MSVVARYSVAPITGLLAAPRVFAVLVAGSAWALGPAWIAAMARISRVAVEPAEEVAVQVAIVAAAFLFGLPALVGLVVGEAGQEVFRRPATGCLPGARSRVARAAFVLGAVTSLVAFVLVQAIWVPLGLRLASSDPELLPCPLATLSVAALGYAAGSWLLVRVGSGWTWVLRLGGYMALAFATQPLLAAGSRSTPLAAVTLAVAVLATLQRYRPALVARLARDSVPTIFSDWRKWSDTGGHAVQPALSGRELLPDGALGGDLRGWLRARAYEQDASGRTVQRWRGFLIFAALPLLLGFAGPLVDRLLRGPDAEYGLLEELALIVLGRDTGAAARSLRPGFALILGMAMAGQAFVASFPLVPGSWRPISRSLRGRLAFHVALRVGFAHTVATLVLGPALGFGLLALAGGTWTGGVPAVVTVALANLVLFPWAVLGALGFRRLLERRYAWVGLLFLLPAFVALHFGAEALETLVSAQDVGAAAWPACALAVAIGFAVARVVLRRHYARADLAS